MILNLIILRDSLAFLVSFAKYMATQMSKNEFEHYLSTNKKHYFNLQILREEIECFETHFDN